jgi:hypothetical protein
MRPRVKGVKGLGYKDSKYAFTVLDVREHPFGRRDDTAVHPP